MTALANGVTQRLAMAMPTAMKIVGSASFTNPLKYPQ